MTRPTPRQNPSLRTAAKIAPALASAVAGYCIGISSAQAAYGPSSAFRALSTDGLALHELARDVVFSGAALLDGVAQLTGSLGFFSAFGLSGHHADGAACASVQGLGFAVLGIAALLIIAIGRMRMVSEQRRLDVARRLIEMGMAPPDGLVVAPAARDLRRGLVSLCSGIGVLAAGLVLGDRGLGAAGLIPAFIGVGYLVSYRLAVGEALLGQRAGPGHGARSGGSPPRRGDPPDFGRGIAEDFDPRDGDS
ncbi:MAG: DUF6249 domain-containing protein [Myxococcota bacterium]